MMTFVAVGAVLALAQAQDDPVEQRVQRLKQQLTLTDEQTVKAREIYKKQSEDLHAILNDEQKKQYDQGGGGRGNGNRGGNQAPGGTTRGGGTRTGRLPGTDELKTQLSLTDDQVTKITAIRDAATAEFRKLFQNRRPAADAGAEMTKIREESNGKIREVLTDEQKPKFDEIVKAAASSTPTPGGNGGTRRGGTVDERLARVMDRLKVADSKEADAIKASVRKVIELMEKLDTYQRDSRGKYDEASRNGELSDQAVGDKISDLLKGQRDLEKELSGARKEVADIVTNRQELELLREGILR